MCIERKDLPGTIIEDRVRSAWLEVKLYWAPREAPIKEIKEQTFRPTSADGLKGVSYKAKAKETWDAWPAIYSLVMRRCSVELERLHT